MREALCDLLPGLKAGASAAERTGVVLVLAADVAEGGGEIGVADAGAEGACTPQGTAQVAQLKIAPFIPALKGGDFWRKH